MIINKSSEIDFIFLIILSVISLSLFLSALKVKGMNQKYYQEYLHALLQLKKISKPGDIVLTEWSQGHQIVTVTGRKVIATSKVYPSESKEVAKRYRDLSYFFFATKESEAQKILKNYHVSFVFISKQLDYRSSCKIPKELCNKQNIMISRLLKKKPFFPLTLVFESSNFFIYKVNEASI